MSTTSSNPSDGWTAPKDTGVLMVDPEQLYAAANKIVALREGFINVASTSVASLYGDCQDMAGTDEVAQLLFAGVYDPLAARMVTALSELAACVGGVPEGLIVSANNYAAADAAATPGAVEPSPQPVPAYGPTWFIRPAPSSGDSYHEMSVGSVLGTLVGNAVDTLLDPLDIIKRYLPMGHQDRLIAAENALNALSNGISELAEQLNAVITSLTVSSAPHDSPTRNPRGGRFPGLLNTNQVNSWRDAMANFCSKIWGAAKDMYGGAGLPPHPLGLAGVAAQKLAGLCLQHRAAIDRTRSALEDRLGEAGLATLVGLATTEVTFGISDLFASFFDEGVLADCVEILLTEYVDPVQRISDDIRLMDLNTLLGKALAAAPTMAAVEASADSVGDRAEHDFSYTGLKTPGSAPSPYGPGYSNKMNSGHPATGVPYPIDLAGQEGTQKSHVISKHVGITDNQLVTRMTTNKADGSGSFATLSAAQQYVQGDLDDPTNAAEIAAWIDDCDSGVGPTPLPVTMQLPPGQVTGRTVVGSPGGYRAVNATGVEAVLIYNKQCDPPFIVSTAYPIT